MGEKLDSQKHTTGSTSSILSMQRIEYDCAAQMRILSTLHYYFNTEFMSSWLTSTKFQYILILVPSDMSNFSIFLLAT